MLQGGINMASDKTTNLSDKTNLFDNDVHKMVQDYYGQELSSSADLKSSACCCNASEMSADAKAALALIPDEIMERFYGCGSPLPPFLEGKTVLDLGCGTGRDVYVASSLVGENGHVIGVDMTPEQLDVARRYQKQMAQAFGYTTSNVTLLDGYIEDLAELGIVDNCIDVVISNCVINLSPEKQTVLDEIYRVLKPGGELYFSDVFADKRIPTALANDPVLRGECLSGGLYVEDFQRMMQRAGFTDVRYVDTSALSIEDPLITAKLDGINLTSRTVRSFKPDGLEDCCEDADDADTSCACSTSACC
jgi:SAM-dependent methyltransferase